MQTVVHEMVHFWQHHHGNPGRGRYHNNEGADKMEAVGLMPSSTGQPGGKRTGDSVADYPIEGGRFLAVCAELLTQDFRISWYGRFAPPAAQQVGQNSFGLTMDLPDGAESVAALEGVDMAAVGTGGGDGAGNKSNRSKYTCSFGVNLWGKPGLNIICGECEGRSASMPSAAAAELVRNAPGAPLMLLCGIGASAAAHRRRAGLGGPPGCGQPLTRPVWTA